jgi:hypothetical protein
MALLFMDGFDHYSAPGGGNTPSKWDGYDQYGAGGGTAAGSGRIGGNAMTVGNGGKPNGFYRDYPNTTTMIVGVGVYFPSVPSTYSGGGGVNMLMLRDVGTTQVYLSVNGSNKFVVYRGDGTLLGTGTATLAAATWYYVELKVLFSDTVGTVDLRVNGNSDISETGKDTKQSANAYCNRVYFGSPGPNDSHYVLIDDHYVCDTTGAVNNDFLGDVRVETLRPSGAGTTTDWTPSAGSNYQNVDDTTPNGDTDYNKSKTAGAIDTYAMGDLATASGTVYGVQYLEYVRKDNAGSRTAAPVARIGGTDYAGTTQSVGDTYAYLREVKETSPATSSAWTVSEINGMEYGIKEVA